MKQKKLSLLLLLVILTGSLSMTVSGEEQKRGDSKGVIEKETFEKSMQERLGKLGAELDKLKKKGASEAEHAEARMKAAVAEAESKRRVAQGKLEELGRISKGSWEKFSLEVETAAKDFEQALERTMR